MFRSSIKLVKQSEKRLNPESIKGQVDSTISRIVSASRANRGWKAKAEIAEPQPINGSGFSYSADISIFCKPKRTRTEESLRNEFDKIVEVVRKSGNSSKWRIASIGGQETPKEELTKDTVDYSAAAIPVEWKQHFSHIYGRDDQIAVALSAVQAAIDSDFQDRFHTVLHGPTSGGKTEIVHSIKAMLGEDSVLEYDATSTTMAGAIKDLNERETLPRVMIVEEIEKADENSLRWLLSVLDHRAEIRKVNFRSNIQKSIKMLCIATVNNFGLFDSMLSNALASRFSHQLYCPRPDRALLQRILEREVAKSKGKMEWIPKALDFCEQRSITDPRRATAICLCGKDELLDGTYQRRLVACEKGA
jgi:hypothetical protein